MAHSTVYLQWTCLIAMATTASITIAAVPGEVVYKGTCIACHGADGEGTLPGVPDLTKPNGALRKSDTELLKNIIDGFQSPGSALSMPPKGGDPALSRQDIEAVIRYMRDTFRNR